VRRRNDQRPEFSARANSQSLLAVTLAEFELFTR
jgi:hypothetical protein